MKPVPPNNHIRAWRDSKGMSQEQVAEAIGGHKSLISKLETGDRRLHKDTMIKLASAFGCRPADILGPPPKAGQDIAAEMGAPLAADAVAAACAALFDGMRGRDLRGDGGLFAKAVVAMARRLARLPSGGIDPSDAKRFADYALDSLGVD